MLWALIEGRRSAISRDTSILPIASLLLPVILLLIALIEIFRLQRHFIPDDSGLKPLSIGIALFIYNDNISPFACCPELIKPEELLYQQKLNRSVAALLHVS
jgi:hypothetical protein